MSTPSDQTPPPGPPSKPPAVPPPEPSKPPAVPPPEPSKPPVVPPPEPSKPPAVPPPEPSKPPAVPPPEPSSVPPREPPPEPVSSAERAAARDPAVAPHSTDDRNLAMLTHLSGLLLSIVIPLVVWLVHKDQPGKEYLVAEAKEALNFQITILIGYVICWILTIVVIGIFLFYALWIINLVFCIIAAIQVSSSGAYRYPFSLRLLN